jgi:peptidoglycan/LPS O-acetylase OafA/YrhL
MSQPVPRGQSVADRGGSRLPALTGLRFVAAFVVFGFHIHAQKMFADPTARKVIGVVFGQGATGVGFFFLLSGFVLTWSARPGTPARTVWRRRAAKILPNHVVTWVITVAGLAASSHAVSPLSSVSGLFLLHAWVPSRDVYFGGNTPAWSLSCEAAFYLAFPLLLRLINRVRERALWPLAITLTIVILLVPALVLPLPTEIAYWLIYVFPVTRALEFALGMAMARIVRSGQWIGLGLWPATTLSVLGYVVSGYLPHGFSYVAGTVIPLALLIPAAAVADLRGTPSPWRNRVWVWLGEVSFAFYLVHEIVIRYTDKALGFNALSTVPAFVVAVLMLAGSILGAWLLLRIVERPMMKFIQGSMTTPSRGKP